ncbi:MAG TPA: efflux RND transporter periplasmic adaptor subunit [Bryobacteraceae bacterium]|nr:efflux RND transporter periplasmic adaptor subunit [Bryobacteraceae bacterium]
MQKMMAHGLRLIPVALAALAASSCSRQPAVEAGATPGTEIPIVAVARVSASDLSRRMVLTAEFKPFQEIDVMAKVAGYIKEINVDVGDRVRQGQLLATLEIPEMADDLQRATAAVERSEAEVDRAKDELQRAQSAHEIAHLSFQRLSGVAKSKPGLVAQQEIDDARSKDLVSEAQISAAKSALDAAVEQVSVSKAELQKIHTMMDYTRVTAPFTGVITKRFADTGAMIQAGTASQTQAMPVVRLSENSLLRLILPVPESAVPTVHIGQQVEVQVPTLHRSFPGKVARFADKLSLTTRTMDTEVDVPNPSLVLIPGMYAEVDLTLAEHAGALALPVMAVDLEQGSDSSASSDQTAGRVMVVTPNHRIEIRNIRLGLQTANRIEVRSGLNDGDMVVLSGRDTLQAGQEVRPRLTKLMASSGS